MVDEKIRKVFESIFDLYPEVKDSKDLTKDLLVAAKAIQSIWVHIHPDT